MNDRKFTVEFERRINYLKECIDYYHSTGNVGSLLPALFSCISYCWCMSSFKKK